MEKSAIITFKYSSFNEDLTKLYIDDELLNNTSSINLKINFDHHLIFHEHVIRFNQKLLILRSCCNNVLGMEPTVILSISNRKRLLTIAFAISYLYLQWINIRSTNNIGIAYYNTEMDNAPTICSSNETYERFAFIAKLQST